MASVLLRSSDIKYFKMLEHGGKVSYLVGTQNCEMFKIKIGKQYANNLAILLKNAKANFIVWYSPFDDGNNNIESCTVVSEEQKNALKLLNNLELHADSKYFTDSKLSLIAKPSTRLLTQSKFIKSLFFTIKQLITAISSLKLQASLILGLLKNNYTSCENTDLAFRHTSTVHTLSADFIVRYAFVKEQAIGNFIRRLDKDNPIFSSPIGKLNIQASHSLIELNNKTNNYSQYVMLNQFIALTSLVYKNGKHYADREINQKNNSQLGEILTCFEHFQIY